MSRIDSPPSFRVQGEVTSLGKMAKEKPGFAIAATAGQIAELTLHEEQTQAREAAAVRYADQNPDKIYAQVVVEGKVMATVYDCRHLLPGSRNRPYRKSPRAVSARWRRKCPGTLPAPAWQQPTARRSNPCIALPRWEM
jgi:hypothetical protein